MNFIKAWSKTLFLRLRNRLALLIAFIVVVAVSCNKVDNNSFILTKNTQPSNLQHQDTATVQLQTIFSSRVYTNNLTADQLGTFIDPVFGRTTAVINTQMVPLNAEIPVFNAASVIDSFVLSLKVSPIAIAGGASAAIAAPSITGNTSDVQTLRVYKLGAGLISNKTYPSDTFLPLNGWVGTYTGSFNGMLKTDSVLRIRLSPSFADTFKSAMLGANAGIYNDLSTFLNFLPGITIAPDSAKHGSGAYGATIPFDLNNTSSRATIYYHNDTTHYRFDMVMNTSVRVNTFSHNYQGTEVAAHLSPTAPADRAYIQALGGVKVKLSLPYLKEYTKHDIIGLQQAELVFTNIDSANDLKSLEPSFMLLRPRDANGVDCLGGCGFTDDQMGYYGGVYDVNTKTYRFIITKYIQGMLYNLRNNPNYVDYGMNLSIPADNPNTLSRLIIGSYHNANHDLRPKLILTYTKISG